MGTRRSRLAVAARLRSRALAGCGGGEDDGDEAEALAVYVSLPLTGPAGADGRDAADGAELALADAGGEAGGVAVEAEVLDGGDGERGWTPARAAANARDGDRDSTAIAYIGDLESGATRASLPITNQARMLQVSPGSGANDLVSEFAGSDKTSALQPGGERTFGRVIPSDSAQAQQRRSGDGARGRRRGALSSQSDFARTCRARSRCGGNLGLRFRSRPGRSSATWRRGEHFLSLDHRSAADFG